MKSLLFFLIASLFCVSPGVAHERQNVDHFEKIYVHPGQIAFASDGIYVHLDDEWVAAESVHADAQGIYVESQKYMHWTCPKCTHVNNWWNNHCQNCGYP